MKKIPLGWNDAALVFRASGTFELILPDSHENAVVPDHVMNATRAALLIKCPEAVKVVQDFMEKCRAN